MSEAGRYLQKNKMFTATMRRMKALHTLLSALDDLGGYTKVQLIAYLCDMPEEVINSVLLVEGLLASDWRRLGRPSAAEVGALENELELGLNSGGQLDPDEEVVVYADDGMFNNVPVRTLMLY